MSKTSRHLSMPALLLGGLLPDLDYLSVIIPGIHNLHRIATHNLFFILAGAAVALFLAPKHRRAPACIAFILGGALHLVVDSVIDANPSNGTGVALLWPLNRSIYFSPFNLVASHPGFSDQSGLWLTIRTLPANLPWEIPFYLGAAFLLWRERRFRND